MTTDELMALADAYADATADEETSSHECWRSIDYRNRRIDQRAAARTALRSALEAAVGERDAARALAASHSDECEKWAAMHQRSKAEIATLKAEAQERILQALSDNGKWIEETSRLRAERDAAVKDAVPLASIRAIAVEAIRTVVGSPDVRGKDGLYLVDEIESTALAAARLFAAGAAQTKETP